MILALLLSAVLIVANGFFVASEFAFIAARRTRVEQLAASGRATAAAAVKSMRELPRMFAGSQLGITMASLGLGSVLEPSVGAVFESLAERIEFLPKDLGHTAAFLAALLVVAFFHMVFGEMVPKNLTIASPESSAMFVALPMRVWTFVFRPVTVGLSRLAKVILRLMRVEARDELSAAHTAAEIAGMLATSRQEGMIAETQHRLLTRALAFGQREAAAVMVPRERVHTIGSDATVAEAESLVRETGHSRLPVTGQEGHIVGFLHAKDLLHIGGDERLEPVPGDLVRPMLVVPAATKLRNVLVRMRRRRTHFALVVDDQNNELGIVTLEDVLEEVVGDILDEHDVAVTAGRGRRFLRRTTRR